MPPIRLAVQPLTGVAARLKSPSKPIGFHERKEPLWKGPEKDGITYSLLCKFLSCRERFRLLVIDGIKPDEGFNHRLEFGTMWHVCEEALASGKRNWDDGLLAHCKGYSKRFPLQQEQVDHWYRTIKAQFPVYVDYWSRHEDVVARTPLLQEVAFSVPYQLPSGRIVRLRGKWDSVDVIGNGKAAGIYLQENKTKGDIDPIGLQRQLTFDLQTMIYLVALVKWIDELCQDDPGQAETFGRYPIRGVRYNVIRRPWSGGKGSIKQHQPSKKNPQGESKEAFFQRFVDEYLTAEPEYWFMRWKSEVSGQDIERFRRICLDPILEQLCDWWEWVRVTETDPFSTEDHGRCGPHWRHPFGVYNSVDEGGYSDLDAHLDTGSEVGLIQASTLFPELELGNPLA